MGNSLNYQIQRRMRIVIRCKAERERAIPINNLDFDGKRRFNVECKQRVKMKKLFFGVV
jgi:hypothetical protein